jgi:arabinan endo-1,5-alpha-L-arabinosidase
MNRRHEPEHTLRHGFRHIARHRLKAAALALAVAAGALAAAVPGAAAGTTAAATTAASTTTTAARATGIAVSDTAATGITARQAAPQTFANPVFTPDLPDPSVFHDASTGEWYAYGTTDYWTSDSSSLHIMPIVESRDLTHWTFVRNVFSPAGSTPGAGSPDESAWAGNPYLWAPEIHLIGGRYVMYYVASGTAAGGSAIGVATASSPAGPWHDSGGPLIGPEADPSGGYYSIIDPDEITGPDGRRYLYYGSFNLGIHVVELTANGLSVRPGSTPKLVAAAGFYEGADVVQHGGYYYLFASSGNCCVGPNSGYEEVVGRSRSPLGPFTDKLGVPLNDGGISVVMADNGNDFVGPGGITTFTDDGQWWLVAHVIPEDAPYLSSGASARPLALEPLRWGSGGWPVINGGRGVTAGPQPAPGTARARSQSPQSTPNAPGSLGRIPAPGPPLPTYSQDFTGDTLGPQWSWVNEDPANWSLTSDPGTLTIDGQDGQFYETEHDGQNVLLEPAPSGDFTVETKVALNPTESYQQAGLVLWQDDDTWLRLTAESNSGKDATEWAKQTDVTSSYPGFSCGPAYPASTCPVYGSAFAEIPGFSPAAGAAGGNGTWTWLRIVKQGGTATAYTSLDGHHWTAAATYNLTGFDTSAPLKIGILATAAGAPDPIPAHFAYMHVSRLEN